MKTNEQISQEMHELAKECCLPIDKPFLTILQPRRNINEIPAQDLSSRLGRMVDATAMSISYHAIDGNPVDVARNWLMEKAIEDDPAYVFFVDEDTVVPYNAVSTLMATAKKYPNTIVNGIYYIKFAGKMMSTIDDKGRICPVDAEPNTGIVRNTASMGLGCTLIPMHIIKDMKAKLEGIPLFCCVGDKTWGDDGITFVGEDTWFYNLARRCGYETIADTSIQCLHMELVTGKYTAHPSVDLTDYVTNIPITTPLTLADRPRVFKDYFSRMHQGIPTNEISQDEKDLQAGILKMRGIIWEHGLKDLCEFAKTLKDITTVVEIGSYRGQSMEIIVEEIRPATFISYDPYPIGYDGPTITNKNRKNVMDDFDRSADYVTSKFNTKVIQCLQTSEALSSIEGYNVDMFYIDGNHSYEAVLADIKNVVAYGENFVLAGHDYSIVGVRQALDELGYTDLEFFKDDSWCVKYLINKEKSL